MIVLENHVNLHASERFEKLTMSKKTPISSIKLAYADLLQSHYKVFSYDERKMIKQLYRQVDLEVLTPTLYPGNPVVFKLAVAKILLEEIGLGRSSVAAFLLHELVTESDVLSHDALVKQFGKSAGLLIQGLSKVRDLYAKSTSLASENFRKLLLTFAEDLRVVLIIVAEQLHIMRCLHEYPEDTRYDIAMESIFLYAPLVHRMGLYAIKTELEDLSLKHTNRAIYSEIAQKLNETKSSRESYINAFIQPLEEKLAQTKMNFSIKGRTKSIHSIYNKIQKHHTAFENIYDLFAIRIILDVPPEQEKAACWQAYSIVADMYQPNPNRLRDWLSIPKSNGYESLHTTVLGPQNKWVEVQIRTVRMDEIAEKGLAAHWKYKGLQTDTGMDQWLSNIREILENPELNAVDFMDEFKLNLYKEEVFVFTPNGDLHKFPMGATALDFAFAIHTNLGTRCVGAKVNGKNVPIKYVLQNGDQVEVLTSNAQKPNHSWLNIVATSKARNKIRQALKEIEFKDAELGRELLTRRFKNWKLDLDDGKIFQLSKKKGYKTISDFFQALASEKLDIIDVREAYLELLKKESLDTMPAVRSAESFTKEVVVPDDLQKEDVLIIGKDLKQIDYQLAKCCNPIYGDDVFGFVSVSGGIKIHRKNCPNAPEMIARYGYRIVPVHWAGKYEGKQYPIILLIVGQDDIGIVANITSLISKEKDISLRSIAVNSQAGLFEGNLTIMVSDNKQLDMIVKKISRIKGVKQVLRN